MELAPAACAFDGLAETYDTLFTESKIGHSQRSVVRKKALLVFPRGSSMLELNCGTGADALFFAESGRNVLACDGSQGMIEHARQKLSPQQERSGKVEFR